MKLRYKILSGIGATLLLGIGTLMAVTSYDSPCPAASTVAASPDTMRAMKHRCYSVTNGVKAENVPKPVPGDGQVLIKVRAASVNPVEWYGASGQPYLTRLMGGVGLPDDDLIGVDGDAAQRSQHPDDGRLPAGNAASESDLEDHARLRCAAVTVFCISMAIVIGPTPPGTGVIQDATSRTRA